MRYVIVVSSVLAASLTACGSAKFDGSNRKATLQQATGTTDTATGTDTAPETSTSTSTSTGTTTSTSTATSTDTSTPTSTDTATSTGTSTSAGPCDPLNGRTLAGWTVTLDSAGKLQIDGDESDDTLTMTPPADNLDAEGLVVLNDGGAAPYPTYRCVKTIELNGKGGNDSVSFTVLNVVKMTLNGDDGNDVFKQLPGGAKHGGPLELNGGNGDDTFDLSGDSGGWSGVTANGGDGN